MFASESPVFLRGKQNRKGEGKPRVHGRILIAVVLSWSWAVGTRAQKWERMNPEGGMVVSLGASVGGDVFLGTADGHIFLRENGAKKWELRGRVGLRTDAVVTRLVSDPHGAQRVFAAVWYQEPGAGGGVFRSDDGGRSWTLVGLQGEAVRALEMAPSYPKELVAGTRSGVFRSRDEGESWERISPAGDEELQNVDSVAVKPDNADVIYAGTYHLPWKTVDGGKSWKPVAAGLIDDSDIMSLRVDATNPERIYLSACSGIYRSENQGGMWTKLQGIPYEARRTQAIVQDGKNPKTLYAATTEGLWVTRDAGESWRRTTPKDWVVNAVVVLPAVGSEGERQLVGTEAQGVLESTNAGESFAAVNEGFTHLVVKQLVRDSSESRHLLMVLERGTQEILESRDGGKSWVAISLEAEDGHKKTKLNADAVEEIYGGPWGWLARLRSGELWCWQESRGSWIPWKLRATTSREEMKAETGMNKLRNATTPSRVTSTGLQFAREDLYVATREGVMKCNRSGICEALKVFGRSEDAGALWVSPDGQYVDVISGGKLGISQDGGKTAIWRDLPVSGKAARWVETSYRSGNLEVFLGTDHGLYESSDTGIRWKLREEGLPAGQVEGWLHSADLMVATLREGGMYISRDKGSSWTRIDTDAERGGFEGFVEVERGVLVVGSKSEGLLRLDVGLKP